MRKYSPADVPPLAISVRQFCDLYACSRAHAIKLIRSGELPSFVDGARRKILFEEARSLALRKAAAGGGIPPEVSAAKSAAGKKGRAAQIEAMTAESGAA